MNKLPTSPEELSKAFTTELRRSIRRTGLTLFYFGAIILGATSHAMDPLRPGSGQVIPKAELGPSTELRTGRELRNAARDGNIKQVETLLKQGAPIDTKDNHGYTPLMRAAQFGREQICKLLIENKATIDAKDNNGWTPLMYAASCDHEQTCKLLIENKATIDAKDNYGRTPLMRAAQFGHQQTCKLLIDALLVPVKQKQAAAISFLGIKKYKKSPCVGFNQNDREVIRLIVRPAYECSKRHLFDQINAIEDQALKQRLVDYAKQQLRMQNGETSQNCCIQ